MFSDLFNTDVHSLEPCDTLSYLAPHKLQTMCNNLNIALNIKWNCYGYGSVTISFLIDLRSVLQLLVLIRTRSRVTRHFIWIQFV